MATVTIRREDGRRLTVLLSSITLDQRQEMINDSNFLEFLGSGDFYIGPRDMNFCLFYLLHYHQTLIPGKCLMNTFECILNE